MGTKYTKEFKKEAMRLGEREGVAAASENRLPLYILTRTQVKSLVFD